MLYLRTNTSSMVAILAANAIAVKARVPIFRTRVIDCSVASWPLELLAKRGRTKKASIADTACEAAPSENRSTASLAIAAINPSAAKIPIAT